MTNKEENINQEWLTKHTGDPFADIGGYVIKYLKEKFPDKEILDLIEYMAKIYVNKWEGKIDVFFNNSKITNPSIKDKIKETVKYFESLIDETAIHQEGYCRITGQATKLFKAGRENSLMSGSGTFVNFHHNFQSGIMLSKEMIIRMFFVPFGTILIGGLVAIIHTNQSEVNEFFVKNNCDINIRNIASSTTTGILKSEFGIPSNALFNFIDALFTSQIKIATDKTKYLSLTLYLSSNYKSNVKIVIYKLPSSIFKFYSTCKNSTLKSDWEKFIFSHYTNSKFKGAKYNIETSSYELTKKEQIEKIELEEYKTWRNIVLENLLNGKSILTLFVKWGKKHKFNFEIVKLYQKHVQNMKKETLDKIKELALFLTNDSEDAIKKSIKALDGYKNSYELRRFFLKNIVAKNYKDGAKNTIITMEELVYYLFPDDHSWRDTRDILLFAIYQELHAKDMIIEAELSNENEETE